MRKIENWNNIEKDEVVEFVNLGAGPQICKILKVVDVTDREYLKIAFDVSSGEFENCFKAQFDRDDRDEKKWPNSGIMYKSYKASASRFFAAFITAVEKSNSGFSWNFDETKLVGLTFVANFREEEWLSDDHDDVGNQIAKMSLKCFEPRSTQALKNNKIKVLEPKLVDLKAGQTRTPVEHKEEKVIVTKQSEELPKGNFNNVEDDLPF